MGLPPQTLPEERCPSDSLLRFVAVLRRGEEMTDGNLGLQYREKTGTL